MQGAVGLTNVLTIPPGATSTQQRIVIDGVRGAIFEYAAGGPLGALVSSWASSAGTDPYGNVYPAGFSIGLGSVFAGTDFIISSTGLFFYSGTPALSNLAYSITLAAGTDAEGNSTLAGFTSYSGSSTKWQAVSLGGVAGAVVWYQMSTANMNGTWAQTGQITPEFGAAVISNNSGFGFAWGTSGTPEPTSVNGQLNLLELASAPATIAGAAVLYGQSAAGLKVVDPSDGNLYDTERLTVITSGGLTINSTSPIVILTAPVSARTYRLRMNIVWQGGATASSAVIGGDGSCVVSDLAGVIRVGRASTNAYTVVPVNQTSNFANRSEPFVASEFEVHEFDGVITFSTAGSFNIRGQETTSGDTWGVANNSYMELCPVG